MVYRDQSSAESAGCSGGGVAAGSGEAFSPLRRFLVAALGFYKRWISPVLPSACRFYPTCSDYAREAVERYGALRGSWMALRRLLRCHPFCEGGVDPVPRTAEQRRAEC